MIRLSADWMVIWDDRLMEILATNGPSTPTNLSDRDEILVSTPHISNRLKKLSENDLLTPLGNGVHSISLEGIGYLMGKYNAQTREWIDYDEESDERLPIFTDDKYMISKLYNELFGSFNRPPQER